jgi:deoxyribose-phosphate aldolase
MSNPLDHLTEEQRKELVKRVAERVRTQLQRDLVPPLSSIHGTWQEKGDLRALANVGASRIGVLAGGHGTAKETPAELAKYIDHTLLKPTTTRADVVRVCEEAREYGFASVCLNTTWIALAKKLLVGTAVKPIAVVGFPLGAMVSTAKAAETRQAIADGALEIDMVINIGGLKGGDHDMVYRDIRAVVEAAGGYPVKVILETAMLTREEKIAGCALSKAAEAHFVKTSTGFGGGGATVEDVSLMRSTVGPEMGVKASGGVRSSADVQKMLSAGATRVGASASVAIVQGKTSNSSY